MSEEIMTWDRPEMAENGREQRNQQSMGALH